MGAFNWISSYIDRVVAPLNSTVLLCGCRLVLTTVPAFGSICSTGCWLIRCVVEDLCLVRIGLSKQFVPVHGAFFLLPEQWCCLGLLGIIHPAPALLMHFLMRKKTSELVSWCRFVNMHVSQWGSSRKVSVSMNLGAKWWPLLQIISLTIYLIPNPKCDHICWLTVFPK